jgi:small subunit ribosomal protein S1
MDESQASPARSASSSESNADEEMLDLLADSSAGFRSLRRGEIVEGVVVQVGRDEVLVDIGTKAEAIIPAHEVGAPHGDVGATVHAGETILAMVLEPENYEGHAVLSLARAQAERGWRRLQQSFEQGETIEAPVVDFNKGGLIVHIDGVRGFVPLSQVVDLRQPGAAEETTEARLERMVGRTLALKTIELNRNRNRLILSERAADQERRIRERDRLVEDLEVGQTRTGRVTSIADFGAFVDLGGADGLVHLTELSWTPVSHPSQVVHVGDQVEVLVLGVDRERKKIALSLKRLRGEPWADVPQRFHVGQNVTARITKLATFGAFAEIEPGIEGLIHISELADARIQHPKNVVREGDVVTVKILRIEPERRRLGLSLRQAQEDAEADEMRNLPRVYGATDYGAAAEGEWMGGARVIRESPPPPEDVEHESLAPTDDVERESPSTPTDPTDASK